MRRVLLSLCCLAGTASANTIATDAGSAEASYSEAPSARRIEGRVGMLIGGSDVGDADGFSVGVSAGLGYRIGDLTLRALFDHYRTGDSDGETIEGGVRRGRGTRVGGAVRYSFANTGSDSGLNADFWGEAGAGLEHVAWRQGGVLDRPSGEIALGFELDRAGAQVRRGHRSHIGYFMDFRSFIAQGPEMTGAAVCGGPCSRATKPSRTDVSMFFELGLHWGH